MSDAATRNISLYPWFKFFQNLLFWQATWFLFFQSELSAAEAILIYVFADRTIRHAAGLFRRHLIFKSSV